MASSGFGPLRWVSFPVSWPTSGSSSPYIVRTTTRPADCVEAARVVSGCVETVRVESPEVLFVKVSPAYASGDSATQVDSPGICFVTRSTYPSFKSIHVLDLNDVFARFGDFSTRVTSLEMLGFTRSMYPSFKSILVVLGFTRSAHPSFKSIHVLALDDVFTRSGDSARRVASRSTYPLFKPIHVLALDDVFTKLGDSARRVASRSKYPLFTPIHVLDLSGDAAASAYQENHILKHTQPGTRRGMPGAQRKWP